MQYLYIILSDIFKNKKVDAYNVLINNLKTQFDIINTNSVS